MNTYNTQNLSLNSLADQLVSVGWTDSYKLNVIKEYEKFLCLRSTNDKLSPSNDVDIVWHQHILNTKHYREYCNAKFGFFIDHDPTDAFDQSARKIRLANTFSEYKTKFGEPNPVVWKEATSLKLANKTKQNKKLIWYENKQLYEDYKQGKEILKIIFTINRSGEYNGSTIMYLTDDDITLAKLADIVDKRIGVTNIMKIRWITKDESKSYGFSANKKNYFDNGPRHIFDMEPNTMKITHYYNNHIELVAHYALPNEGC